MSRLSALHPARAIARAGALAATCLVLAACGGGTDAGAPAAAEADAKAAAVARPVRITFNVSPRRIPEGRSATLRWTVRNATTCSAASGDDGAWSGARSASGKQVVTAPFPGCGQRRYTLTCTGPGGSASQEVVLTVQGATLAWGSGNWDQVRWGGGAPGACSAPST